MTNRDQPTNEYRISRRMALATLTTLSTSLLTKVQAGPLTALVMQEFLTQCATSITTCWALLNGDGLATVEYSLPKYLPLLIVLAQQPSKYQKTAAYLGSPKRLRMPRSFKQGRNEPTTSDGLGGWELFKSSSLFLF